MSSLSLQPTLEDEFRLLVDEHRAGLQAHCYRMLGSLHDAEDAFQETLLRAWRGLPEFGGRSSLRTWLYRIATNVCIDAISRRSKRVLPIDYGPATAPTLQNGAPLVESVWVEPYPDEPLGIAEGYASPDARYEQREAVELAFIASLQHLPGRQRAVLILRDVLGFSAREVSESLNTTVMAVNSALRRAREAVAQRLPERSQQATLRSLGDDRMRRLVQAFIEAWSTADIDGVRQLLAEDAVLSMPPGRAGGAVVRRFPASSRRSGRCATRAWSRPARTGSWPWPPTACARRAEPVRHRA